MVLPDRARSESPHERGGGAARATAAAATLGARLPPIHAPLREHRRAQAAAAHDPREADSLRRAHLSVDVRRSDGMEPWRRAPRVPAHAVAGPGGAARGDASTALRGHDARVPGAPRGVAAVRRGRGARISIGDRIRARRRRRRELPPGAASPRLLQPGGAGLVVVGAPRARLARRRRLVARRRRGTAGVGQAGRGRRPAAAQHLRSLPSPGIRRGRGGRAAGSPRVPALPLGRRRDAAVRRLVLVGRREQRLSDAGGADPARTEHRAVGRAVLGDRRGRLLSSGAGDR